MKPDFCMKISVCLVSTQFFIPSVVEQTFGALNDCKYWLAEAFLGAKIDWSPHSPTPGTLDIGPGFCQAEDDTKMSNAAAEGRGAIQWHLGSLHEVQQGQIPGPPPG